MIKASDLEFIRMDESHVRIPKQGKMRVDGIIYADEKIMKGLAGDESPVQVANVAQLPGIIKYSLAMPDIHWGYGFPIGGVAAFDLSEGVVSPGGVGYDINCGVRLIRSELEKKDLEGKVAGIVSALFSSIPSGVGSKGPIRLSAHEERDVLSQGAAWAVSQGYGEKDDLGHIEEGGKMGGANPEVVSPKAKERGRPQLGTLGSGNHFVEIDYVAEIYDEAVARVFGLFKDQVVIQVHTGSRGLGHQVCDDYIRILSEAARRYKIELPDRQLCCAPIDSKEGREYLGAMAAAVNYAFANRQIITHWVRESFSQALGQSPGKIGLQLVYDVAHNIAKIENHLVDGKERKVCVHRKGATRAFPAGHPAVPEDYRSAGQPVLIPGDMGRESFVLVGTPRAMTESWGSACHGAGRVMSRTEAIRRARGRSIARELEDLNIVVMASSRETLSEEMPEAYKDVARVVDCVQAAGIARKVARLKPMGVIKG